MSDFFDFILDLKLLNKIAFYETEYQHRVIDSINKNKVTVLKGICGGGITSLLAAYAAYRLIEGKDKNIDFYNPITNRVSPTANLIEHIISQYIDAARFKRIQVSQYTIKFEFGKNALTVQSIELLSAQPVDFIIMDNVEDLLAYQTPLIHPLNRYRGIFSGTPKPNAYWFQHRYYDALRNNFAVSIDPLEVYTVEELRVKQQNMNADWFSHQYLGKFN